MNLNRIFPPALAVFATGFATFGTFTPRFLRLFSLSVGCYEDRRSRLHTHYRSRLHIHHRKGHHPARQRCRHHSRQYQRSYLFTLFLFFLPAFLFLFFNFFVSLS